MQFGGDVNRRSLDILIATTAIEHDLKLVARTSRHFQDIDGLSGFA
jgi:predicted nucleic acid-binding protein